jgi:hypothetical protein
MCIRRILGCMNKEQWQKMGTYIFCSSLLIPCGKRTEEGQQEIMRMK